jgi:hypothetical protein
MDLLLRVPEMEIHNKIIIVIVIVIAAILLFAPRLLLLLLRDALLLLPALTLSTSIPVSLFLLLFRFFA